MKSFHGRLISHNGGEAFDVGIQTDEDWVRAFTGHKRLGAWRREDIQCERVTAFRFRLNLDGVIYTFTPSDPTGFSDAVGAVIDLRPSTRFGLGPRVKAAKDEMAATRAGNADID